MLNIANSVAALLALLPFLAAAFFPARLRSCTRPITQGAAVWPAVLSSAALSLPYLIVAGAAGIFRWGWMALYALLPVAVSGLCWQARRSDPDQRGNWRDYAVLAALGLPVDLRWFEGAWSAHLAIFSKILLPDAGIYGLLLIRGLEGAGFDLRVSGRDILTGMREFLFYASIAIPLGLGLGFLHLHVGWPSPWRALEALFFTFFFIAAPEELFFRGWLQNLLQRRMPRSWALLATASLFGLAHFNKRAAHFNWRYVILALLAGIFYGRAWRSKARVGASAVTHCLVDVAWSLWLR